MGQDSHFASTLTGKILRKIALEQDYRTFYEQGRPPALPDQLKNITQQLFDGLRTAKQQLLLNTNELLTTLTLLVTDGREGHILTVGDGVVNVNGQLTVFDQDNQPDYLGYHLGKDFETWYGQQNQRLSFGLLEDVSIASDGILLFERLTNNDPEVDPTQYLLQDKTRIEKADMLDLKLKTLEFEYGMVPGDDLAIIRLLP